MVGLCPVDGDQATLKGGLRVASPSGVQPPCVPTRGNAPVGIAASSFHGGVLWIHRWSRSCVQHSSTTWAGALERGRGLGVSVPRARTHGSLLPANVLPYWGPLPPAVGLGGSAPMAGAVATSSGRPGVGLDCSVYQVVSGPEDPPARAAAGARPAGAGGCGAAGVSMPCQVSDGWLPECRIRDSRYWKRWRRCAAGRPPRVILGGTRALRATVVLPGRVGDSATGLRG